MGFFVDGQVEMRSLGSALNQPVLPRGASLGTDTGAHRGRRPRENECRGRAMPVPSKDAKSASQTREAGETPGMDPSLVPSEGGRPCRRLWRGLPAPGTVGRYISAV